MPGVYGLRFKSPLDLKWNVVKNTSVEKAFCGIFYEMAFFMTDFFKPICIHYFILFFIKKRNYNKHYCAIHLFVIHEEFLIPPKKYSINFIILLLFWLLHSNLRSYCIRLFIPIFIHYFILFFTKKNLNYNRNCCAIHLFLIHLESLIPPKK